MLTVFKGKDGDVATHDLIVKEGGKAIFVKADVSIAADVENLVAAAVAEYGRVDVYVPTLSFNEPLLICIQYCEQCRNLPRTCVRSEIDR